MRNLFKINLYFIQTTICICTSHYFLISLSSIFGTIEKNMYASSKQTSRQNLILYSLFYFNFPKGIIININWSFISRQRLQNLYFRVHIQYIYTQMNIYFRESKGRRERFLLVWWCASKALQVFWEDFYIFDSYIYDFRIRFKILLSILSQIYKKYFYICVK